jgi:DNA-binding NtrC family response regulator
MDRIIICHGDSSFNDLLCKVLSEEGYDVESVYDCNEALKRLLSAKFKVFILGIRKETQEFTEIIPLIKTVDKALALITIVDDDSIEIQKKIRKQKVFYHLVKPLNTDEIKDVVRDAMAWSGGCS